MQLNKDQPLTSFRCAIALGSNLGNSQEILDQTLTELAQISGIQRITPSSWYETIPVGPPQPNYVNGCAIVETKLHPEILLENLLIIEQQFGRIRQERWGARTLDLDILLYDNLILKTPNLTIPHPRMNERAFVLVPLAEIAPNWIEPISQKSIFQLSQEIDTSGIIHCVKQAN
ncbi:MAG: 2-amino-4-hydroxy-6-hydroxymethyldihydropteridine diphosphokinase [Snowella sp.]|nr:2-amino-4-hydroxy-6-hydroxymethyldihydropteridine diphosphokinase [Snowella sp.]